MKVAVLDIFDDIAEAASWLAEKLDPIIEAIKVIAGSDLYEDFRGEKMTGKTSATAKAKSTTQTSFASAFGESLAANPSKAFDAWAETAQGQGMLREDPVEFYTLKNASEQATSYTAPSTSTSYRTEAENAALEVARAQDAALWQKQYGSNGGTVSLDSTSVTALASALSTNGATYQKTRYAY